MPPYKVLIVDDSVFMRKIISDLVSEHPNFHVVGTAKNGKEAIGMVKTLKPDVVTMDIEMPEMNGLDALSAIMKEAPTPVIMLSNLTQDGARETIRALELGAIDFVGKPSGSISLDLFKVKSLLHEKLEIAVKSKLRAPLARPEPPRLAPEAAPPGPAPSLRQAKTGTDKPANPEGQKFIHLVAIGTSTGGPRALQQVLTQIPEHFPAPILIVQHMPPNFTQSLAVRLDSISRIRVVEAQDGMTLAAGTAYIAPGGFHMSVLREPGGMYRIRTSKEEPRSGHRPSVDVMFESVLPLHELKRHIVLMTGMGSDGAKGMLALREAGAVTTIAESEETCVVYGMPRAAVELNAAMHTVPVFDIPGKLVKAVMNN